MDVSFNIAGEMTSRKLFFFLLCLNQMMMNEKKIRLDFYCSDLGLFLNCLFFWKMFIIVAISCLFFFMCFEKRFDFSTDLLVFWLVIVEAWICVIFVLIAFSFFNGKCRIFLSILEIKISSDLLRHTMNVQELVSLDEEQ